MSLNFGKISQLKYLFALLIIFIIGCLNYGRNFTMPQDDSFLPEKTTYEQVVKQFGQPYKMSGGKINETDVKIIGYEFFRENGEALSDDIYAMRQATFTFSDDKLVGYFFNSSFKSDNTNFDESKLSLIKKGETTKANVIEIMGKPSGISVYPLMKKRNEIGYIYLYDYLTRPLSDSKFHQKRVIISLDGNDTVSEISFTDLGENKISP